MADETHRLRRLLREAERAFAASEAVAERIAGKAERIRRACAHQPPEIATLVLARVDALECEVLISRRIARAAVEQAVREIDELAAKHWSE